MARADVEPAAEDTAPRLLHADEERLRLVAATLARGGRFVLVVASADLWRAAAQFLRGLLPDHRFVERFPASSEETVRTIDDPLRDDRQTTIVLHVTGADVEPIEALNLRRESLTGAAANFLVVLQGDTVHRRFLQEAPDCYSYRDVLVVLEGEPSFEPPESDESDNWINFLVDRARQLVDPERQAIGLAAAANELQRKGQNNRARELLEEAISALSATDYGEDDDECSFLAELYYLSAEGCSRTERYKRIKKSLELLAPIAERHSEQFATTKAGLLDAIGIDPEAALDAVKRARGDSGVALEPMLVALASAYWARDSLLRAREILAELYEADADHPGMFAGTSTAWLVLHFHLFVLEGGWDRANQLASSQVLWGHGHPAHRAQRDLLRARLFMWRGEGRAAQRLYETQLSSIKSKLALIQIAAERARIQEVGALLHQTLNQMQAVSSVNVDDLIGAHVILFRVTELDIAMGGTLLTQEALDARLASLCLYVRSCKDVDPPWNQIRCLMMQSDALLKRLNVEGEALRYAEEAWKLAEAHARVLASSVARRLVVASLRLGDLAQAREWLIRGFSRAREHEHRGDEAHLRGLALWHAVLAGGDVERAEAEMRAAIAATGSRLVEGAVLARVGSALGRQDLLRRAQQIYRSLPWPEREGACLEALGETRIAEARYRTFDMIARLRILERRTEPPPITAVDDPDPWS